MFSTSKYLTCKICSFVLQTPNSCFNDMDYFDDDNTSLLCNESIDCLDLDDIPRLAKAIF